MMYNCHLGFDYAYYSNHLKSFTPNIRILAMINTSFYNYRDFMKWIQPNLK